MILNTINLDSCLISELTGLTTQTTNIVLTDPLGSVIATFSTTAGSAALSGNQAYGHLRYNAGGLSGMATSKGFSGQYSDAFSGLDYYNARYYQPAVGVFLSADSKEGNQQGMDPYMYVGGNPETYNDPTGEYYAPPPQGNGSPPPTCVQLNDCWSGSGGSGQPPTSRQNPPPTRPTHQGVKLPGGCDPSVDHSIACKAWAWDASNVRSQRLDSLNHKALLEMLAGYLLFLTGDVISFISSSGLLEKIEAFLDFGATILYSIIPLVGQLFGGSVLETTLRLSSWVSNIMGNVEIVMGALRSADSWITIPEEIATSLAIAGATGPAGVFVQGLMIVLKPMIGDLIDAGGHFLISKGLADLAEVVRQNNMPLQSWCAQYGRCPSYSSYH